MAELEPTTEQLLADIETYGLISAEKLKTFTRDELDAVMGFIGMGACGIDIADSVEKA